MPGVANSTTKVPNFGPGECIISRNDMAKHIRTRPQPWVYTVSQPPLRADRNKASMARVFRIASSSETTG